MTAALTGQLLALASAFSFAFGSIFISRTEKSAGDRGVMFSVVVTMAMSAALWLILEAGQGTEVEAMALAWFAVAGVSAMVFGRNLLYASVRQLGVARSTAVKRLNPFFSVLLAAAILGEHITPIDGIGIAAIAAAFAVLIHDAVRRQRVGLANEAPVLAYLIGVGSAFAYGLAYVTRKLGLEISPVPALGTLVSAVAGFATFLMMAVLSRRMRGNLYGMVAHVDRWIAMAAVMVSLGQILLFMALAYERVSTVVMIASLEVFLSIFLAVVVFRSERMPGPPVLFAAGLALAGVVLVAH